MLGLFDINMLGRAGTRKLNLPKMLEGASLKKLLHVNMLDGVDRKKRSFFAENLR